MSLIEEIDKDRLPQHVAIIMDGNGRWQSARKDRSYGHQEGVVSVRKSGRGGNDDWTEVPDSVHIFDRKLEPA